MSPEKLRRALKTFGLTPLARFAGYAVAGVPPEIMGIGPIEAIPRLLKLTGVALPAIDRQRSYSASASGANAFKPA